jgi:O-methyltransferase
MSRLRTHASYWFKRIELLTLRNGWPTLMFRNHEGHSIAREKDFLDLYGRLHGQRLLLQSISEAYNVWDVCRSTGEISHADIAEAGVYKGGSARLICGVRGSRTLHLFDTFGDNGGMPETMAGVDPFHHKGDFGDSRLERVKQLFSEEKNVHFYPGFFPATAGPVKDRCFSMVHLDMDIYQSTLDGLIFFWPRVVPGGILISHDYSCLGNAGVKKAFDEFFAGQKVPRIRLWDMHVAVVKPPSDAR